MATMSKYLADRVLDWVRTQDERTFALPDRRPPDPAPVPVMTLQLSTGEVATLGAAAVLTRNPVVSRRFWGDKK